MFTGMVEELGKVNEVKTGINSSKLKIGCKTIMDDVKIGDSVAVNGVCLTATSVGVSEFTADVMNETLRRSNLSGLKKGDVVNLERAMLANGRFGGHIVSGHIDGTGTICDIKKDDVAVWYTVKADKKILKYIIEKGSVTLDGISLTVAKVTSESFWVSIIPHTAKETGIGSKKVGDSLNIENDLIGKYIEKLMTYRDEKSSGGLTMEMLINANF